MFYHIFIPLIKYVSAFNIFRYITFRAGYGMLTALLISFLCGPMLIRALKRWQVKETIRNDGPESHLAKEGTVSMGGLIVLAGIILPTILWSRLDNQYVHLALFATVWMGLVGFVDDYLKIKRRIPKGLVAKYKLAGQILLGILLGSYLYFYSKDSQNALITMIPFLKNNYLDYTNWIIYMTVITIVITATTNAVNLTDGLDGLAIGLVAIASGTFAIICYVVGRVTTAEYLGVLYISECSELTVFCLAITGASLGFLWYNFHPARIFMGDTGSLALGGALGTVAILSKTEILLIIIGGVFVFEVLSVIIQVGSFKMRGKRVFNMAPIHHHFELKGWAEELVVVRFWIIGFLLSVVALTTLKMR